MSLGTATVNLDEGRSGGPHPMTRITFDGDDSYPTGGTPNFQAAVRTAFGADLEVVDVIPGNCGDFLPSYDKATDKLFVRLISTGVEARGGQNLSATSFNLTVIGK